MTARCACEYWKKHPLKRNWEVTDRQRGILTVLEHQNDWVSTSEVVALVFPQAHKTGSNYLIVRNGLIGLLRRQLITCKTVVMPKRREKQIRDGSWKPVTKNKRIITLWKVKRN